MKDYGLDRAMTGEECFNRIQEIHKKAISLGATISYKGLEQLFIEIPNGAKSIPLSRDTDFAGVEFLVKNTKVHSFPLFDLSQEMETVLVSKEEITAGLFNNVRELRRGRKLLIIEDETPWVVNRLGYNYGATRKDILYLKRGKAQGSVISTYNNDFSSPKCFYCDVKGQRTRIRNLIFTRSDDSERITRLFIIKNQNDVTIENVTINTPDSDLYGDAAIGIHNVTKLKMIDVTINGTYSQKQQFGYGISMNNVWNARFVRLKAHGNWGVFGNNNVNYTVIENSDINRFDIHCYGRDVFCYRTTFRNIYNQFSSLYGQLVFDGCEFINCIPVLFEYSYDAYTPFELLLKKCKIIANNKYPYLVAAGNVKPPVDGAREELRETSWPNVTIDNVEVILPPGQKSWMLFKLNSRPTARVNHICKIKIKGLILNGNDEMSSLKFSNYDVQTVTNVETMVTESSIQQMEF